jgi:hypothetical protein
LKACTSWQPYQSNPKSTSVTSSDFIERGSRGQKNPAPVAG